jgi:hypothetical protein
LTLRGERGLDPTAPRPATDGRDAAYTAHDVARALRHARVRQGLSVKDVGLRTGIPVSQLRAAETASLSLPDQLATLKTVRAYADFLGLPGDRYALALLEHWPTKGAPGGSGTSPTATIPAVPKPDGSGDGAGDATAGTAAGTAAATAPVPLITPVAPAREVGSEPFYAFEDTGVSPAVPAVGAPVYRGRGRVPAGLRVGVGVTAVAVATALAFLAIDRLRPSWLGVATPPSPAGARPTTPAPAPRAAHPAHHRTTAAPSVTLRPVTTTPASTVFRVGTSPFQLTVSATPIGPCWVQVSVPTATAPAFAGMLSPGQSTTVSVARSATVEVGSSSGRISVAVGSEHVLSTYAPRVAPSRTTFDTGS